MPDNGGAVTASDLPGDIGDARITGIEAGREARPLGRWTQKEQREFGSVEVDGHPAAAADGIWDRHRALRLGAERKIPKEGPALAKRRLGDLVVPGFGEAGQMMPLLMAVAIAIARLLADSFWIAWVT